MSRQAVTCSVPRHDQKCQEAPAGHWDLLGKPRHAYHLGGDSAMAEVFEYSSLLICSRRPHPRTGTVE